MKLYWPNNVEFDHALKNLTRQKIFEPFDQEVLKFIQALSKKLIRIRSNPEIVSLGYWLRKANIQEMYQAWEIENSRKIIKGRGTVFHIAPSNVDTIFVYSWMLSLLAGNRNIIRVSGKGQSNGLLDQILQVIALPEFESVASRTIICTYGHEEKITEKISMSCHTRVIWGGDSTISTIRQSRLAPMANELTFPDRFSLAALSAEAVVDLDVQALDKLIEQFYNDVFWFDQMACSSPRLVIWSGTGIESAQSRFWAAFEKKIQEKKYELMASTQVLKYSTALWLATSNDVEEVKNATFFSRVQFKDLPDDARERHCGGGLFFEIEVEEINQLAKIIIDKDQTLSYFGYDRNVLKTLIDDIPTRGLDRMVPIGQALNFDGVWDGQNFLKSFTREVVVL
ncbi:acyl-CoA reductase [Robertmurraya massiliosenegalensis]|uniref:acyl-CoA reductase n=1 Tax=Robertmurraya massiliosenegalensis TaxID=1287657 RepID=UPI0003087294|nr:acyl-CoA reductase [Robertmurraya massiliosenegalensis]